MYKNDLFRHKRVDDNILYELIGSAESECNHFGTICLGTVEWDIVKILVEKYLDYTLDNVWQDLIDSEQHRRNS